MKFSECLGLDGKIAEIQTHDTNDNTFAIIDEIYLITRKHSWFCWTWGKLWTLGFSWLKFIWRLEKLLTPNGVFIASWIALQPERLNSIVGRLMMSVQIENLYVKLNN